MIDSHISCNNLDKQHNAFYIGVDNLQIPVTTGIFCLSIQVMSVSTFALIQTCCCGIGSNFLLGGKD